MNLFFSTAHLNTLTKLKEMAEKHNCKIVFSIRYGCNRDLDDETLKLCKVDKRIIDKFNYPEKHSITIEDYLSSESKICFEFYDNEKHKCYTMSFVELECFFRIEKDFDYDEQKEKFLEKFIEENRVDWSEDEILMNFRTCPTIIYGFGYKKRHIDYRVYRPDMALKYFGDLVCKYLKEPYIKETY